MKRQQKEMKGRNMRQEKKIVIIDGNQEMQRFYEQSLEDTDYRICGAAADGKTGLQLVRDQKPDIIITEMILPRIDGIELLDQLYKTREIQKKPAALIVSYIRKEELIESAFNSGAAYYLLKPVSRDSLLKRLDRIWESRQMITEPPYGRLYSIPGSGNPEKSLEDKVTRLLRAAAVPAHIKGYQYLRDCIMIAARQKDSIHSVTKSLYPAVAKMNHTTTANVERSIRNAIQITFSRNHSQLLDRLFAYTMNRERSRPTSAEFIAILADHIRLESD